MLRGLRLQRPGPLALADRPQRGRHVPRLRGPPVDGFYFAEDFLNSAHPFTPCTPLSITPPLPALPVPTTSDELPPLHIHAPPAAGARYLLVIEAHASADTFLDGQASADQLLAINKVTVRFRSR